MRKKKKEWKVLLKMEGRDKARDEKIEQRKGRRRNKR